MGFYLHKRASQTRLAMPFLVPWFWPFLATPILQVTAWRAKAVNHHDKWREINRDSWRRCLVVAHYRWREGRPPSPKGEGLRAQPVLDGRTEVKPPASSTDGSLNVKRCAQMQGWSSTCVGAVVERRGVADRDQESLGAQQPGGDLGPRFGAGVVNQPIALGLELLGGSGDVGDFAL